MFQNRKIKMQRKYNVLQYILMVSYACAQIFITRLHQLDPPRNIELRPHWLLLVKVQCQVLNR